MALQPRVATFLVVFRELDTFGMQTQLVGMIDGKPCRRCKLRMCEEHREQWQRLSALATQPIEPEPKHAPSRKNGRSGMTDAELMRRDAEIAAFEWGGLSRAEIAKRYGLSVSNVGRILQRFRERSDSGAASAAAAFREPSPAANGTG